MTKRPPQEEFMDLYAQYESRRDAVTAITEQFEVTESTAYEWVKKYVSSITSSANVETNEEMEDFFDIVDNLLEQDMERKYRKATIDIPVDSGGILVVCQSDFHVGNRYVDMKMLAEDVKEICETDGVYAIVLGDVVDAAGVKTTPHKNLLLDQVLTFKQSKNVIRKMYEYYGHKVLVTTTGCHGVWSYNDTGEYFTEELAEMTDTKVFLEHGGLVTFNLGEQSYNIAMRHKIRGNSKLNPTRGILRLHEQGMDFDLGIGAHHHEPAIHVLPRREKLIYGIKCGTYKLLDNFGSMAGFVQQKMTIPGVYISADKHEIIPFIDWRQGLDLLR